MQTLGYGKEECLEFFLNCVDQLLYWKKIQFSTAQNWKKNIRTIYRIFDENNKDERRGNVKIEGLEHSYFCGEVLAHPEQFQVILQNSETMAAGRSDGLSNTTISNYMQMLFFIMRNIAICTDDENIIEHPVFKMQNLKRWEKAWGALKIDSTNARLYSYTNKILEANADWGDLGNMIKKEYLKNPNNIKVVTTYLLYLTYNTLCARNDYGSCFIYTRGVEVPLKKRLTTNYIDLNTNTIHVNDTKNKRDIGNKEYKTYQELSEEYLNVLARSLRLLPRAYLFTGEQGSYIGDDHFGEFINKHLGKYYKYTEKGVEKNLITGCDMIRHLFAQHYYRLSRQAMENRDASEQQQAEGVKIFLDSIEKMLHSQTTHMEGYITPYMNTHPVNLQNLERKTRTFHYKPHYTKVFTKDDRQIDKIKYYIDVYYKRMEEYGDDYVDVFGFNNSSVLERDGNNYSPKTIAEYVEKLLRNSSLSTAECNKIRNAIKNSNQNYEKYVNLREKSKREGHVYIPDLEYNLPKNAEAEPPVQWNTHNYEKFQHQLDERPPFFKSKSTDMFMTNTQFALETVNYEIAKNVPHFEQQEKEPIEEHEEPVQPIRERQQPRQPINNPKPTKNLGSSRNVTTAQINKMYRSRRHRKRTPTGGAFVKMRIPQYGRGLHVFNFF